MRGRARRLGFGQGRACRRENSSFASLLVKEGMPKDKIQIRDGKGKKKRHQMCFKTHLMSSLCLLPFHYCFPLLI